MSYQSSYTFPPPSMRPINLTSNDLLNTIAYIETAMPPPPQPVQPTQSSQTAQNNDVAGVLRRNQACLACRRRKLKCDAVRPHCGTCVKSHRHAVRTSSKSDHVLTCDYDDGTNCAEGDGTSPDNVEVEVEVAGKKKRKATGDSKRKKKDEEDKQTEQLRKKIEALEAQLKNQRNPSATAESSQAYQQSTSTGQPGVTAPSPTAFLDMLSQAATAHVAESNDVNGMGPGADNPIMSGPWGSTPGPEGSTGLTPFLSFNENQQAHLASDRPDIHRQESGTSSHMNVDGQSRRSSQQGSNDSPRYTGQTMSGETSSFSSSGLFNFPPTSGPPRTCGMPWRPTDADFGKPAGTWREVETAANVFGQNQEKSAQSQAAQTQAEDFPSIDGLGLDAATQQQLLLDLFWPGWPPNVPQPHILNEIVNSFFDLVPNMPRLLNRARFLARLTLPPTHSNFPHPALLHAICASASAWCDPKVYAGSMPGEYPGLVPNGPAGTYRSLYADHAGGKWSEESSVHTTPFATQQAHYGKGAVQEGLDTGNRLFDVVRAMIIFSRVFIDDTRMLECWAYAGLVARMILPLGLNVRSAELSLKSVMLPPPIDALEREERRVTVWMALYHDTVASAASGWGSSMSLDELTIPLPVSAEEFDRGSEQMLSNPQDLDSSDLWTKHPVADPFVLVIKGTSQRARGQAALMSMAGSLILNRANKFVRRWKNRHLRDNDDLDGMQRTEFRELANAIACLQMSFPQNLRNPAKLSAGKRLDIDLIAAHMLPHCATICLYEPFADITDPQDGPSRRILAAAQHIVSIVQQLAALTGESVQNFAAIMHSSVSVCLVTAARTILLYYRVALNNQDMVMAEGHRMDIEMIRMALEQFGLNFKIGHHHAQLIGYFLDRASNPTYEKLRAHYPEHPRPGAPDLHPTADLGKCIMNALNIKRGYWKAFDQIPSNSGQSPMGSTPGSAAYASSAAGRHSTSGSSTQNNSGTNSRISAGPLRDSPKSTEATQSGVAMAFGSTMWSVPWGEQGYRGGGQAARIDTISPPAVDSSIYVDGRGGLTKESVEVFEQALKANGPGGTLYPAWALR